MKPFATTVPLKSVSAELMMMSSLRFADMAIDAIGFALGEAYWRQRTAVDVSHLLLGVICVDTEVARIFEAEGLTWPKLSEDVDDYVGAGIGLSSAADVVWPVYTSAFEEVLKNSSELAYSTKSERVSSDHLLLRLVEVKAVSNLLEDRWNVLKFNLEQEAYRGLHAFSEKNKRTRQYRITIAKKHIEILRYRELNSRTLAQKAQLRDLIKIRHQWEDELASLVPTVEQDG